MSSRARSQSLPALSAAAQRTLRALTAPLLDSLSATPQISPVHPGIPHPQAEGKNEPTPARKPPQNPLESTPESLGIPHDSPEFPKIPQQNAPAQIEPTTPQTSNPLTSNLSPRQLSSIDLLFAGHSLSSVTRTLNIDRKTLYNWRRSRPYLDEIRRRATAPRTATAPLH